MLNAFRDIKVKVISHCKETNIVTLLPIIVADNPLGGAKPPYPQAFHVHNRSWIYN